MSSWQTSGQTNILRSQLEANTGQCCNQRISQSFSSFLTLVVLLVYYRFWLFHITSHFSCFVNFRCFLLLLFSRPTSNILSFSFSVDALLHTIFVFYCRCIVLPLFCTFVVSNSRCFYFRCCSLSLFRIFVV